MAEYGPDIDNLDNKQNNDEDDDDEDDDDEESRNLVHGDHPRRREVVGVPGVRESQGLFQRFQVIFMFF